MIKKIHVQNTNSIGKTVISFEKGRYQFKEEMVNNNNIVNPVAIYGTNGSGKTSFIKSIRSIVNLMVDPVQDLRTVNLNVSNLHKIKNIIEDRNLTATEVAQLATSIVQIEFILGDDEYKYAISLFSNSIATEVLKVNNEMIFERFGGEYNMKGKHKLENVSVLMPLLRLLYKPEINNEYVDKCYEFISNFAIISSDRGDFTCKKINELSYWDLMVNKSNEVHETLQKYNQFPVYKFKKQDDNNKDIFKQSKYIFEMEVDGKTLEMPHELLSSGMFNQSFLLSILFSLPKNGVLIVDELEQALHPTIIPSFIQVVQQRNIQLIFSSHNTNILSYLRPDQIFFSKWKDGYSSLKRLSDFHENIRAVNNIEKMYLSHLFDEDINDD